MIRHMNEDHVEAMIHYCEIADILLAKGTVPTLAGIDSEGFHLRLEARIVRFDFETPVKSLLEVRKALIALAYK
jgi:putative heme iron utilization protein